MAYLVRKLLHGAFLLLAVTLSLFALFALAPGDFFSELRLNPALRTGSIEQLRAQQELDRPLPARYWHWVHAVLRGDWGESLAYQVPVWPLLRERAGNTLLLTTIAAAVSWMLALPLGIWGAVRQGSLGDRVLLFVTSALLGIPEIMLGLLLLAWAVRTRSLPAGGMVSLGHDLLPPMASVLDRVRHMVLPVAALVFVAWPGLVRHVRAGMIEAMDAPSVRTARATGIRGLRIVLRHALPLASNPLISLLGLSIAGLLGGSLLVEWIMSWPGLGPLLLEAIFARDVFVVMGAVLLTTVLLVAGNLLADVLLVVVDPQLREQRP